jgi:hypothetical protein
MEVDVNCLYLSCFSSSINTNIPYTVGQIYMPDRLLQSFKCDTEKKNTYVLSIINNKKDPFIIEIKISYADANKNQFVNFPTYYEE